MIERLEISVKNVISAVENLYPNIIENMAGAVFQTTAHLEMLTPDYNAVVKDKVTDNYGFQLYALIVSGSVREDHQDLAATKKNYYEEFDQLPFIQKVTKFKLS